jgi:hypothetical protein
VVEVLFADFFWAAQLGVQWSRHGPLPLVCHAEGFTKNRERSRKVTVAGIEKENSGTRAELSRSHCYPIG